MATYELRLRNGFPAKKRTRAGVTLTRDRSLIVELDKDQLQQINADSQIICKPTTDVKVSHTDSTVTPDLTEKSRKDLDIIAKEIGLKPHDYKNKAEIIEAIENAG